MPTSEFNRLAERLWGHGWQTKAARHFEVADRTVRRWVAGTSPVPLGVMDQVRAMADIAPPPGSTDDHDRDDACADAIEPGLTDLRNRAVGAGWHPAEIAAAILALTVSEIRSNAGDPVAVQVLEEAIAAIRG